MNRLAGFLLLALLLLPAKGWAWDGRWTQGRSGHGNDIFEDTGRSEQQSGTDPPQKFWIAGPRDHANVDPEELPDYFGHRKPDYAPYALARVEQTLRYQNFTLPKGYYLIKPGDANDGSPLVTMATHSNRIDNGNQSNLGSDNSPELESAGESAVESSLTLPLEPTENGVTSAASQPSASPVARPAQLSSRVAFYQTFVIIRQGKVLGVVPVHRMTPYKPPKGQKIPRRALAWVEWENRHPVLKFYYKKWLYETEFQ